LTLTGRGDAEARSASDLLWKCWEEGLRLTALPKDIRPKTRQDGYAIQAWLEARSAAPLFGWKIAATSVAGQAHINVDGPLAGRLLREKAFDTGATVLFGANHMRVGEAEFAFRMASDMPPRDAPYPTSDVLDAVRSLHPAIEIPDSRFDDFTIVGAPQLIADNACAHLFVLGPEAPAVWRDIDLVAHAVTGSVGGRLIAGRDAGPIAGRPFTGRRGSELTREGRGGNVLGDPRVALTWLVNELSGLGITLKAGEVVTTGTCLTPLPIAPGDEMTADFGMLGRVSVFIGDT
jgi:2-keto-4-pentenoate hydratase